MMASTESSLLTGLIIVFFLLLFIIMALIVTKPEMIPFLKNIILDLPYYARYAIDEITGWIRDLISFAI